MYLKEISYLLCIAQHGTISKAAEELYISQPALSKYLKNVEFQVGAPLFSRVGGNLVPTHVGRRYLEHASKIAGYQAAWNLERSDLIGETKGQMTIIIPPMRSSCIIPTIMPEFWKKFPDVKLDLMEESTLVLKRLLAFHEVDFVIASNINPLPNFVHERLGDEEVVLIMPFGSPLANLGVQKEGCRYPWIDLKLLYDQPFVLNQANQSTGMLSHALFEEAGIIPNVLLYTRNTEVAIRLTAAGTALSFAPETYVRNITFDTPPLCFSVGKPRTENSLYVSYERGRYLPSYAKYFCNLIRDNMKQLYTP